jgi:hypothetical protein
MPWPPELFSGPALERIFDQAATDARAAAPVPYFAGVRSGETDALVRSFAGEPELHHPIRGRVKGRRAFERFVTETNAWLTARNAVGGHVERTITARRGIEETVLTLDGDRGRIELPIGIVADRDELVALYELFFSNGGGIALEHCAVADDGRSCALEYNVVRWGRTDLPPEAGLAVYVRGPNGRLASARVYDDADPPLDSAP